MPGNEFLVGAQGDAIVILRPPTRLTAAQAVRLAAWLVAISEGAPDGGHDAFAKAYAEVIAT